MSHILPSAVRRRIKSFLTFIRGDKVGKMSESSKTSKTGKANIHPNIEALTQLPHPRDRTIHGDIPIYYLQVPAHSVTKIRGPDAPDPPLWGVGENQPDADGFCTWQLAFENGPVIYIRSQTVPETGPGKHVIAPNGSEAFIPQSLLTFDITYLTADDAAIPPLATTPGPSGVVTLLSPRATVAFEGRTCKACRGNGVHTEFCPTLQSDDYVCSWCNARGGGHSFRCNGFL